MELSSEWSHFRISLTDCTVQAKIHNCGFYSIWEAKPQRVELTIQFVKGGKRRQDYGTAYYYLMKLPNAIIKLLLDNSSDAMLRSNNFCLI